MAVRYSAIIKQPLLLLFNSKPLPLLKLCISSVIIYYTPPINAPLCCAVFFNPLFIRKGPAYSQFPGFNRFLMLFTAYGLVFHTRKSGFSDAFICRNFARPPGIIFPLRVISF